MLTCSGWNAGSSPVVASNNKGPVTEQVNFFALMMCGINEMKVGTEG